MAALEKRKKKRRRKMAFATVTATWCMLAAAVGMRTTTTTWNSGILLASAQDIEQLADSSAIIEQAEAPTGPEGPETEVPSDILEQLEQDAAGVEELLANFGTNVPTSCTLLCLPHVVVSLLFNHDKHNSLIPHHSTSINKNKKQQGKTLSTPLTVPHHSAEDTGVTHTSRRRSGRVRSGSSAHTRASGRNGRTRRSLSRCQTRSRRRNSRAYQTLFK